MAASLLQSALAVHTPQAAAAATILADRNAWYLLQGGLFLIAFFACMLFMVSARLSADLQAKLVGHKSPQATQERLTGIGEALDRMFLLINRFMVSDRDGGFQPAVMDVETLMTELRLHFDLRGGGDRLLLTIDDADTLLHADLDMLTTIMINLIDNALKYSPAGRVVDITTHTDEQQLCICVHDRGIGIPAAQRYKVGQRFFRASNAAGRPGTGLGLYTVYRLLAYHDGTLELQNNDDNGTTARLYLPLAATDANPYPATESKT